MPAQPLLEDARSREPAPAIAIRIPVRLVGLILLGLVAIVMVSLATWSVDDPSFSYATSKPPQNWLGFPGAVIADMSFQLFGIGILAVLVPPALWAWSFVRLRVPSKMGLRLIAWLAASVLACGVFSFIAAPESWPLPLGLGGLIGTLFTNLATLATGENPARHRKPSAVSMTRRLAGVTAGRVVTTGMSAGWASRAASRSQA